MYDFLVFLHLVAVVVGIGSVSLNGLYADHARKRQGAEGVAVSEANFAVSKVAEWFIYGIVVTGVLAILASDDAHDFSETWVWLSIVLYVVAVGISHAIVIPGHRRMIELGRRAGAGPAEGAEMAAIGKRVAPAGMVLDLLAIVLIALMVWKPGN